MESSSLVGDFLSPESTVTCLLSSTGHLRSSLLAPEGITTFRYRDKNYDSASAALDAYIADFESSHQNSKRVTGSLVLPHSPPSTPSRPRVSTLRNKDVLRERLTDRELDFLNLPVSSLHHSVNRDRLSMTTDELLSIPYDGSMPVTHTSAFIQGLLSKSGASQPSPSSSRPAPRSWDRLSSSHTVPQLNHHLPHPARSPGSSRCRGRPKVAMLKPEAGISSIGCYKSLHETAGSKWAEPSSSSRLPHWFTSNKSDVDCSGPTGVSDLMYPAWIQRCDLSEAPPLTESELWDDHGVFPPAVARPGAPSWVAELEDDDSDQTPAQIDSQQTLRDLRLQFAEQISLLAAEKKSSDIMETLFRDNRIESLIQKADQVLNTLSQSSGGVDHPADPAETRTQVSAMDCVEEAVSPLNKDDWLLCSSSHFQPVTLESAAGGATGALSDGRAQVSHGNSIMKQPGPAEALKQMLFRLQAVEAELQRQQQASPAAVRADRLQAEETPVKQAQTVTLQSPGVEAELESFPGGQSLQRALHHLSRLKKLVEEPREKHRQGEEEKDVDEGRYSSSSTEGLTCAQQKSS